jgi:hypothetical protein
LFFTHRCVSFLFLSYLVLLELPPAEKKGRQVCTCSPFKRI